MPTPISNPVPALDPSTFAFTSALDGVREELLRIPQTELLPIRHDIPTVVTTVLGAAPEVQRHRAALLECFGEADAAIADRLETLARAAAQAHAQFTTAASGTDLEALSKEVVAARTRLFTDAQALVHRGLCNQKALDALAGGQAYKDQCFDTLTLVDLFIRSWPAIAAFTPMTEAELREHADVANTFAIALGLRAQADGGTPAGQLRERAYTLLCRTYDEARRMIAYLRWEEGDVDRIAPSLSAGRTRKRDAPADEGGIAPAPSSSTPVRPGLPGADPFDRS